ncbi:hypothetical protein VDGE_06753 [Verticillium dahliae]|uniref:Uncharacterized protein n=1 Tax=Verticillium dahliae TaxID=27337 RepID=A0A444S8B4_VERDA|nr:hypothetical protein VDGE_06753 [Verticillium dahliae]
MEQSLGRFRFSSVRKRTTRTCGLSGPLTMESTGEPATAGMADPPSTEQLLQAAASADDEDLRRLTQYYTTDIDIRNQDGLSALHLAILSQHDGAVEALVEANADIEATTPDGRRPLFLAIEGSRTEVVRFLLAHHALTDADAGGRMPLHEAASRGNVHIARLLLDYGADIQALSTDERDALFFAVRSQDLAVAQLLLDRGADPDAYLSEDPPTALHLASELCDVEMMRMLLERRAKVDLRDFNGATPLFRVVAAGNIEAAKLLLQHGASIRVWASGGFSALDLADGNLEMLELLNGDRVLQGPKVRGAGPADEPEATFTVLKPPPTPAEHERDKLTACQGFNAIITDFFLNGEEHEQSVPKTASVALPETLTALSLSSHFYILKPLLDIKLWRLHWQELVIVQIAQGTFNFRLGWASRYLQQ